MRTGRRDFHIICSLSAFLAKTAWIRGLYQCLSVTISGKNFFFLPTAYRLASGGQASYSKGIEGSFPEGKAAAAWNSHLTSIQYRGQAYMELYLYSPMRLHGVYLIKHRHNFTLNLLSHCLCGLNPWILETDHQSLPFHFTLLWSHPK
jgi:hypothetical protein